MKRIVVLHAQIPFEHGGAELMVEKLVQELKKRDYDTELISIPFRWYPEHGLYNNLLMWRMLDLSEFNGKKIDLVIPTKFPTYGIQHPNKVLWLMHQHRAAYDLYMNKDHFGLGTIEHGHEMQTVIQNFDNKTIKESQNIFSISQNVANRLYSNNRLTATPLYHPPALAGRYYCDKFENYILSVGRLDPLKRIHMLINSLKYCENNINLIIAGTGPEEEHLHKLVHENNLDTRVKMLGFVSDAELIQLYANATAIYFSPIDEDYGYVTLEAFLSHKPIITCKDSGGVLEFANENNAIICECETKSISNAINTLIADKNKAVELGNNGFDIASRITWDNVIDSLTCSL